MPVIVFKNFPDKVHFIFVSEQYVVFCSINRVSARIVGLVQPKFRDYDAYEIK